MILALAKSGVEQASRLCDRASRPVLGLGLLLGLLMPGCACPHRSATTLHTLEWFDPAQRTDGMVAKETWKDTEGGGGFFLFADPNVQSMSAIHTNQTALGGGSAFTAGSIVIVVDSNVVPAISAGGTAVGNILGAAAKSAVK